jgi:LITAF-like zinc ribbon domain.
VFIFGYSIIKYAVFDLYYLEPNRNNPNQHQPVYRSRLIPTVLPQKLERFPIRINCGNCGADIVTATRISYSKCQWGACFCLTFFMYVIPVTLILFLKVFSKLKNKHKKNFLLFSHFMLKICPRISLSRLMTLIKSSKFIDLVTHCNQREAGIITLV